MRGVRESEDKAEAGAVAVCRSHGAWRGHFFVDDLPFFVLLRCSSLSPRRTMTEGSGSKTHLSVEEDFEQNDARRIGPSPIHLVRRTPRTTSRARAAAGFDASVFVRCVPQLFVLRPDLAQQRQSCSSFLKSAIALRRRCLLVIESARTALLVKREGQRNLEHTPEPTLPGFVFSAPRPESEAARRGKREEQADVGLKMTRSATSRRESDHLVRPGHGIQDSQGDSAAPIEEAATSKANLGRSSQSSPSPPPAARILNTD
ncbi:hypothetical protein RTBOTA2_004090 [Rhodotorula toruloides]|nr:hypothetical protein RTBOTA2_004090 [Rhodotorula toruloides]